MNVVDARILIKRSTITSTPPTIPISDDHTDGSWIDTDIYKGEFFINLVDEIVSFRSDNGIVNIFDSANPSWKSTGNTLSTRGKFGSTSGAYGWDDYIDNVVVRGISNTGQSYYGTNAAFSSTDNSYKGSGNTSASYNAQWKNSSSSVLGWIRNDGVFYTPKISDSSGNTVLDNNLRQFYDSSGNIFFDCNLFYFYGNGGNRSMDTWTRTLNDSPGNAVCYWAGTNAAFEISSTTKGFLPPRMTTTQKNAISSPVAGTVVYDSTLGKLCLYTTAWETVTSV